MPPLLFITHTKRESIASPTDAGKDNDSHQVKYVDNSISRDTPILTKQTAEAFDTWVGAEDLILITKILSLNGSRMR